MFLLSDPNSLNVNSLLNLNRACEEVEDTPDKMLVGETSRFALFTLCPMFKAILTSLRIDF